MAMPLAGGEEAGGEAGGNYRYEIQAVLRSMGGEAEVAGETESHADDDEEQAASSGDEWEAAAAEYEDD